MSKVRILANILEEGLSVRESLPQATAYTVVFGVVFWLLNCVATDYGCVPVVVVGFVGCEINFPKEPEGGKRLVLKSHWEEK